MTSAKWKMELDTSSTISRPSTECRLSGTWWVTMFFLIDKPVGMTSFDVIRKLRKTLGIKKMGHTGTLDPLASGLILIATGNSTKLIPLLEWAYKRYLTTIRWDGHTESYDLGSPLTHISKTPLIDRSEKEIIKFLENITSQIPPRHSALHIDGERAYEKARRWEDFSLSSRPIEVQRVEVVKRDEESITIELTVSSGGYIRSFAPIVAEFFGRKDCGYLSSLCRTAISNSQIHLSLSDSSEIENPEEISYNKLFHTFHTYEISYEEYLAIAQWKTLKRSWNQENEGELCFFTHNGHMSLMKFNGDVYQVVKNEVI